MYTLNITFAFLQAFFLLILLLQILWQQLYFCQPVVHHDRNFPIIIPPPRRFACSGIVYVSGFKFLCRIGCRFPFANMAIGTIVTSCYYCLGGYYFRLITLTYNYCDLNFVTKCFVSIRELYSSRKGHKTVWSGGEICVSKCLTVEINVLGTNTVRNVE
jgi:hypothetical protein